MKKVFTIAILAFAFTSCTTEEIENVTCTHNQTNNTTIIVVNHPEAPPKPEEPGEVEPIDKTIPNWLQGTFKSYYLPNTDLLQISDVEIRLDLRNDFQPAINGEYYLNIYEIEEIEKSDYDYKITQNGKQFIFSKNQDPNNPNIHLAVIIDGQEYVPGPYLKQ